QLGAVSDGGRLGRRPRVDRSVEDGGATARDPAIGPAVVDDGRHYTSGKNLSPSRAPGGGVATEPPFQLTRTSVRLVGRAGQLEPVQSTSTTEPAGRSGRPGFQSPAFAVEAVVPTTRLDVPAPMACRAAVVVAPAAMTGGL